MKKKLGVVLSAVLTAALLLTSCGSASKQAAATTTAPAVSTAVTTTQASTQSASTSSTQGTTENGEKRTITDLTGAQVTIPAAADIHKVVIVAPPLAATFACVTKDTSKLVGMNAGSIKNANQSLLDMVIPNWKSINTTFLTGFKSNPEEVMKMSPDIILVYGDAQKEGLENVDIPIVNFFVQNQENEGWSVKIDQLMREIFEIKDENTLQAEWDKANAIVNPVVSKLTDAEKKKGIMIFSNTGDTLTVRGTGTYGDDWMKKTGLVNAADVDGDNVQVSMEQIYSWNPDVIYCMSGMDASSYLSNSISGQDWSQTNAYKNGAIYTLPKGMFNWGVPNVDSPLALLWISKTNYPELFTSLDFSTYMKSFYQRQYNITITDDLENSILHPTMQ